MIEQVAAHQAFLASECSLPGLMLIAEQALGPGIECQASSVMHDFAVSAAADPETSCKVLHCHRNSCSGANIFSINKAAGSDARGSHSVQWTLCV